jgi:hypothetical protein
MIFDINYSTAKTLIRQYRSDNLGYDLSMPTDETTPLLNNEKAVRCTYSFIETKNDKGERTTAHNSLFYLKPI